MSGPPSAPRRPLRYAPLTYTLPRFGIEGGLSGFLVMAFILLVSPVGGQTTRVGRLILLGGSAGLGAVAGATLATLYWWWGRGAYKKSGGPMAPPSDESD